MANTSWFDVVRLTCGIAATIFMHHAATDAVTTCKTWAWNLKRRRKAARKADKRVSYVVRVTGWDRWWSLRVCDGKRESGPYSSLSTLTLWGDVFRPDGFKYPQAEITLSGRSGMMEEEGHPAAVGSIDVKTDLLRAYVFVPAETITKLSILAATDRLKIVHLSGTRLRFRSGTRVSA